MADDDVVCEVELEAAIQVLSEAVVKLERQYVRIQSELLLERAENKQLRAGKLEQDAKLAVQTRLLDSHELRIADLEGRKPTGGTFDA